MAVNRDFCLNCETKLVSSEKFCPNCGQSTKSLPLGIKDISTQILFTLFNLDNTLFRTLSLLPTPWVLTKHYIAGKRTPYYHPGRMFIILLFLLFSVLTIFNFDDSDFELGTDIIITEEDYKVKDRIDFLADSLALDTSSREYVYKMLFDNKVMPHDTMVFEPFIVFDSEATEKKITLRDAVTMPMDSLHSKYKITGFWKKAYYTQFIKLYKNNQDFIKYLIQKSLWAVPLGILLLSLFMKMLYIRSGYYLVEHLVFLMHLHSAIFSFFIVLITLESGLNVPFPEGSAWLGWAIPLFTGFLALREYYQQSWPKTLIKYFLLMLVYFISLVLGLVVILLFSIVTY